MVCFSGSVRFTLEYMFYMAIQSLWRCFDFVKRARGGKHDVSVWTLRCIQTGQSVRVCV